MAFQLSPGINVSEIDLTTVVPAVATTEGATVGVFRWGPTNERILVTSQVELVNRFGKPHTKLANNSISWTNHESFFTAANFLDYSDALYVTRVSEGGVVASSDGAFKAKYEGEIGDSLFVSYAGSEANQDREGVGLITIEPSATTAALVYSTEANNGIEVIEELLVIGDSLLVRGQKLVITNLTNLEANVAIDETGNTAPVYTYTANIEFDKRFITAETITEEYRVQYTYFDVFNQPPQTGHVNIIVIDSDGKITGTPNTILEKWENVSKTPGAKNYDGSTNYLDEFLEQRSSWIAVQDASLITDQSRDYERFNSGSDGLSEDSISIGRLANGWDLYKNTEEVDISFLVQGRPRGTALANYIIDNIAQYRKDCVAFITPPLAEDTVDKIITWSSTLSQSTFAVVDTGYKYQYDKYNDLYRWVPLGADIAGTCARTDQERDSWFSPAGYNRGAIKNVIKLKLNPNRSQRDVLYKNAINPVLIEQGSGAILFGDKTFTRIPSAFDRINVRRLFIVLEKAISVAAKATLFEFNDEFTRAQFVNLVEPFLRDVQGRRGIYDYKVVCDGSNNTGEIIDRNEFVGDIYVKPARSINYIQLNFVAVRTGIEFTEIVG